MASLMERTIAPLKRKLFLIIGRAILTAISTSEKTMKVQVSGLSNETITDVERLQEYGFDSYPAVGTAEVLIVFPNGARDNGVALVVADRENRPTGMAEGDSMVYTKSGTKIWLKDADSSISINDGADFAVRYTKLKEVVDEIQADIATLKNAVIAPQWTVVPQDGGLALQLALGVWAATALAKDIADSKIEEIKVP